MNITVHPTARLSGRVEPPSSKNYTARYLLVSALAEGTSRILRPAVSDDAEAMRRGIETFGATVKGVEGGLEVTGFGRDPKDGQTIDPGNAGAVVRFLMGVAALTSETRFVTPYADSLGKRPHGDLLKALKRLGCECEGTGEDGRLPITIRGGNGRLHGGQVDVSGSVSSQFLSALLFLAPLIEEEVEIRVIDGLKSKPLIHTTLQVLRNAGIRVEASDSLLEFRIAPGQRYDSRTWNVNGDWPGTSALLAAAAVTEGDVEIPNLFEDEQGERGALTVLQRMGARMEHDGETVKKREFAPLQGVEVDGDQMTDAVLALAAAAALAQGTTRFFNVENLRYKECDRITDFLAALREVGVNGEEKRDELIIHGNPDGYEGGVTVSGRGDHRVIMALAVVGLRCKRPITISGAEHVAKSYPAFFEDLRRLGVRVEEM